jgi:hypothetical protein
VRDIPAIFGSHIARRDSLLSGAVCSDWLLQSRYWPLFIRADAPIKAAD